MRSVIHPDEIGPHRAGDAEIRGTFDARSGCELLEQHIIRIARGRFEPRPLASKQELLYVVSGHGTLELDGKRYELESDMGVFVAAGEAYEINADDELELVSVATPASNAAPSSRRVTVRFSDQPEFEASPERTFRYLIDEDAGCSDVTQFLGLVQPSKAPLHSHPYDEVGYIVEGEGIAHVDGEQMPLRQGSCFHLAPGQEHCIENTGAGPMRILGVFYPAGSPAARNE
jgi:mannose-6-phosphate isomerase-like protein (cupin superfamily)